MIVTVVYTQMESIAIHRYVDDGGAAQRWASAAPAAGARDERRLLASAAGRGSAGPAV